MDTEERASKQEDESRSPDPGTTNRIWNSCCGTEIADADQIMRSCPCASMFKGSRGSIFALLGVAGLLSLIIVTGWVLGVVAFFKTI